MPRSSRGPYDLHTFYRCLNMEDGCLRDFGLPLTAHAGGWEHFSPSDH